MTDVLTSADRTRPMRLLLGGPSYRMEVDARHSAKLAEFVVTAHNAGVQTLAVGYQHGTPVALARNNLFREAITLTEATHLLWLDSDCSFATEQMPAMLYALALWNARPNPSPLVGFPTPQRNRELNVWLSREQKLTRLVTDGQLSTCWAVGFGCVAFDLRWYRANWPTAPWFQDRWDHDGGVGYISEDYGHCRDLAARGWAPLYAGAYVDHHDRGEGKLLVEPAAAVG